MPKCTICKEVVAVFNEPGQKPGIYCRKHKTPTSVDVVNKRCTAEGCPKQPRFNFPAFKNAIYCADHKTDGMVNIKSALCVEEGCQRSPAYNYENEKGTRYCGDHKKDGMVSKSSKCGDCTKCATFNVEGEKKGAYCSDHKRDGMVDVVNRRCEDPRCKLVPNFNFKGQTSARFCFEHKLDGMENIHRKVCEECDTTAVFNMPGETRGRRCAAHRLEGMVDVVNRKCAEPDCTRQPNFNVPGKLSGAYCVEHKKDGMVSVTSAKCTFPGCMTEARFSIMTDGKPQFCASHRDVGMINVRSKRCRQPGCRRQPVFNAPGEKSGIYCAEHRPVGFIDVMNRKCADDACIKNPAFNFPGESRGIYCKDHALDGMINVVTRRCDLCERFPSYGVPGAASTRCLRHKVEGMVLRPRLSCAEPNCNEAALFGKSGEGPLHCEAHHGTDEVNLVEHPCVRCGLLFSLNARQECMYCDPEKLPARVKAKEQLVRTWLDAENVTYVSHDKMVDRGECVRYRPDFVMDAGTHVVVLEVDENQHKSYACDCEQIRMVNLAQVFDRRPVVFLRYNPDPYEDDQGKVCKPQTSTRKKTLFERLQVALQTPPTAFCEVLYLFYDGFLGDDEPRRTLIE